uniref:Uncharacterized protein n=1 Tax=Oryza brachyantha TaxID=4533 RepID=J3MGA4_ORYBR
MVRAVYSGLSGGGGACLGLTVGVPCLYSWLSGGGGACPGLMLGVPCLYSGLGGGRGCLPGIDAGSAMLLITENCSPKKLRFRMAAMRKDAMALVPLLSVVATWMSALLGPSLPHLPRLASIGVEAIASAAADVVACAASGDGDLAVVVVAPRMVILTNDNQGTCIMLSRLWSETWGLGLHDPVKANLSPFL